MMDNPVIVRLARASDAPALAEIYAPYVADTAVSFELTPPDCAEFERRISRVLKTHPFLAAERGGEVVGYAYALPFAERAAYIWAAEESVYVSRGVRRAGVGRLLYAELERLLRLQNVASVTACITASNEESIAFHRAQGFETAARFTRCAYKLGKWQDVVWMEKLLNDGSAAPETFIPFPLL